MQAIELEGTIDEQSHLQFDTPISGLPPGRVRVIILAAEFAEPTEAEWLRAAGRNPAFEFLNDPAEDVYSLSDGSRIMAKSKIVLVPFPFDDFSATKVRPALCLTDELGTHRHVVLAFVTSQTPADPLASDLKLDPAHPDFAATGLRGTATVRWHRIMTVSATLIRREIGQLSPGLYSEVEKRLRSLLGL